MRSAVGRSVSLVAFVFLITVTSAGLRADAGADAGRPLADGEAGFLVLQDGGVLSGQITHAADWYVVARGAGQMQVAQSRVQLACRTMDEAYEFRRKQINADKVVDHLRLAEWCIRYELRAEAGRELAEARRIDPDQPRLALLERRLEKGGVSKPAVKESVYLTGAKGAKPPFDKLRTEGQAAEVAPAAGPGVGVSTADLPAGVVERFTRKVQPVLVNNCTTSGCHQAGSKQSFQLDRAILRGESNRRTTMHNLEATLALVDRVHPDQSPLLTVPRRTHGGTSGPIFGPRQEQAYKHVVDWVSLLVDPAEAAPGAADSLVKQASAQTNSPAALLAAKAESEPADVSRPAPRQQFALHAEDAANDDSSMTLRAPHRLKAGVQLKRWQPRDEFDPEIFNRAKQAQLDQTNPQAAQASNSEPGTAAGKR